MKPLYKSLLELSPAIIWPFAPLLSGNEIFLTAIMLCLILVIFKIKYYKNECYLFLAGIVLGIILESIGNSSLGQSWDALFFPFPLWIPLAWGFGFIFFRRIGDIILGKKL